MLLGCLVPGLLGNLFPPGSHFLPDLFRPCPFTLRSVFNRCALLSSVASPLDMMGRGFSNSKGQIRRDGADLCARVRPFDSS